MRSLYLTARLLALVTAVSCSFLPTISQAKEKGSAYRAALESIRADDLSGHVDYLADDALEGREAGQRGGQAAGDYLADRFAQLQVQPAGVGGGFFQPFGDNYRNLLVLLPGSDAELRDQVIVVGAHYDHVGYGTEYNSRGPVGEVHNGADDNASGTSALLELAEAFARLPQPPKRSVLFIAFDAEEMGMLGSKHWVAQPTVSLDRITFMLNMDMIGRLRDDRLTIVGSRSAYGLRRLVSRHNDELGLLLSFTWDIHDNADHHLFFQQGIPVLMPHTGLHDEYHSPRDDAQWINNAGMSRITRLLFHVAYDLADRPETPRFRQAADRESEQLRQRTADRSPKPTSRFGISWQKQPVEDEGIRVTRVAYNSPAQRADLHVGDRIARFAGEEIHDGDDLSGAVMRAENPVKAIVYRTGNTEPEELDVELDGKPMRLGITWRTDEAEPGTIILNRVVAGSPAAEAGLRVGDRIYQVGGEDFDDDRRFIELVNTLSDPLQLLIERDGQLRTVVLHLQAKPIKRAA